MTKLGFPEFGIDSCDLNDESQGPKGLSADMADCVVWAECKCFHQKCLPLSSLSCSVNFSSLEKFRHDYKASLALDSSSHS